MAPFRLIYPFNTELGTLNFLEALSRIMRLYTAFTARVIEFFPHVPTQWLPLQKSRRCVGTKYRLPRVIENAVVGDMKYMHDCSMANLPGKASQEQIDHYMPQNP
jgi:hypothetical protein